MNKEFTKNYSEAKNLYRVFLEEYSKEELQVIDDLVLFVKTSFPSTEEILMMVDGSDDSASVIIKEGKLFGLELMRDLHTKIKAYLSTNNDKTFDILKYHHENVKYTIRRYIKDSISAEVKKEYISNISNDIIIMYVLKNWNEFLHDTVQALIISKK